MDSTVALQMHGNFLYGSYLITNTSGKNTHFLVCELQQLFGKKNPVSPYILMKWFSSTKMMQFDQVLCYALTSPNEAIPCC